MVKKVGKEGFEKLILQATPLPDFLLDNLQQQADINRLDGRAKLGKLAKPLVEKMPNGVLKTLILDKLAVLTQVSAQDLVSSVKSNAAPRTARVKQNANTSHERSPTHPKFHADPTAYLMPASRGPTNSPANPPTHQLTCFKRMAKGTSAPFPTGCIPAPAASPPSLPRSTPWSPRSQPRSLLFFGLPNKMRHSLQPRFP